MITYEEAYRKAKELKPNTNCCTEYENGYMFGSTEDEGYRGGRGHTPCVILKKNGKAIPMNEFVISGTGEMIREFDITD